MAGLGLVYGFFRRGLRSMQDLFKLFHLGLVQRFQPWIHLGWVQDLFRVGLGFIWGKGQILGVFLFTQSYFIQLFGGSFWVHLGLVCIYIVLLGVYFGLRSNKKGEKTAKQNIAEQSKQRSKEAEKQRSRGTQIQKTYPKQKTTFSKKKDLP